MKRYYFFPFVLLAFAGCQSAATAPVAAKDTITVTAAPVPQQHARAVVIEEACAVICTPDNRKLELLKKENGEEGFYTISDDNNYYLANARSFLENKGIRLMEVSSGLLQFKQQNGTFTSIQLDDEQYGWEIFLFNGRTAPVKADITDIEGSFARLQH